MSETPAFWVMTRGEYDDEEIIGVASSEERARSLLSEEGLPGVLDEAGTVYGPFKLDRLSLCNKHRYVNCGSCPTTSALKGVERVRELHNQTMSGYCEECSARDYPDYAVTYPCPTIQALEGTS